MPGVSNVVAMAGVPNALPTRLADAAVALAVVLGSRTAEMLATRSLIIHGSRAFRLAKVGCREADPYMLVASSC